MSNVETDILIKKTVNKRLKKSRQESPEMQSTSIATKHETRTHAGSTVNYIQICFICKKSRDRTGNWTLMLVSTIDRQNSVWSKAAELGDEAMLHSILAITGGCINMVANDFRYHRACMNTYLNKERLDTMETKKKESIYDEAFFISRLQCLLH